MKTTIIKKLILSTTFLLSVSVFADTYGNNESYQNQDWNDVYKDTVTEIKKQKESQNSNYIFNVNKRLNELEKSKRTSFTINSPRVVDVYVRASYTVLEQNYVVKNAPLWKKVLIKQKEVWDY